MYSLDNLEIGKTAKVISINNKGSIKRRLLDLGIVPSSLITAVLGSPFNDPIAYKVKNAIVAIRKSDSRDIMVEEV